MDSSQQFQMFAEGVDFVGSFLMGNSSIHKAMKRLVALFEQAQIPYAIVGAMALNAYGYRRATQDIDVLLTPEGLATFKNAHLGRGYVEKFAGSKGMKDTIHGVPIDVLLAGEYPGDGKPKSVVFPDPAKVAIAGQNVRLLPLSTLVELKLASGISAPHRIRDLADVLELIRICELPESYVEGLDPSVQDRFVQLWKAAQHVEQE